MRPFNLIKRFFCVLKFDISDVFSNRVALNNVVFHASISERCDNMKRKMKIKEFLMRKKVAAGCVVAAAVIAAGSFSMVMQSSDIPELSSYTDPVIETTITGDDTPLASKPKVTTKTTSKTKTTRKKVKLKKASKKSYTKKLPKKKKTTTKTKKSGKTTVKTQTTVQTATSEKYTKKSKQKVVTQKVVTTVKTTTTVESTQQNAQTQTTAVQSSGTQNNASTASTKTASKQTISNVASIAPKMDSRVLNAYSRMGFTVTVDPSYAYAGHFDARSRNITIQEADETVYHELGHFLAFIAGNVDQSSSFASVYNSEKSKFTGYNKAYATQNASEYFAESVKDYMLNGAALSSQRPETYKAIQSALNTVTTARADAILKAYASIWN